MLLFLLSFNTIYRHPPVLLFTQVAKLKLSPHNIQPICHHNWATHNLIQVAWVQLLSAQLTYISCCQDVGAG